MVMDLLGRCKMSGIVHKKYFICRSVKLKYFFSLLIKERLIKRNSVALCYLESNNISILLEKLNNLFARNHSKGFSLVRLDYDFTKIKNSEGVSLLISSATDDLYGVMEKFDSTNQSLNQSLLGCLDDRRAFVKKEMYLYVKQQISMDIFEDIFLVNMTHWFSGEKESELFGKCIVMLLDKKSYWINLVLDFAKSKNVNYLVFHGVNFKRNKGILFFYRFINICIEVGISFFKSKRIKSNLKGVRVGVPFHAPQNATNFIDSKNYDLFWFYESGISPDKILLYTNGRNFAFNEKEIADIKKSKFDIISCEKLITRKISSKVPLYTCTSKIGELLFYYLKQIIEIRKHVKSKFLKEQWKILSLLFIQLPYWEDFFQSNNIKIKFGYHAIFSIQDLAAKISGAVIVCYHYSHQSDMAIWHQEICDVFFIWGKQYENLLNKKYSLTKYLVQTGYIFDYTFNNFKNKALALRKIFNNNNVSYIIGIFDENIGYFGKSQMKAYRAVLEYVKNHFEVGIIIKPKKEFAEAYLRSSPETSQLISILEVQGRLKILDSRKYPSEAGQSCDIVIGVVPDSTAGLECALAGVPMVVYDIYSMQSHPYYSWGYNKVIFDDINHLLSSIEANKGRPGSIKGFADWSPILDAVDPFRDGRANQRIGFYIKTIICKLEEGLSKDDSIKIANSVYMKEYGSDKVIPVKMFSNESGKFPKKNWDNKKTLL